MDTPSPNLTCPTCRYTFADTFTYKRHILASKKKSCIGFYFTCKRCLKPFDRLKDLEKHQASGIQVCSEYKFENKIEQHNRIITHINLESEGFKPFIRKILTPVIINTKTNETKLNFKLIKTVYDSLSITEFDDVITFASLECPDLKFYLLASLKFYINEAPDDKIQKIKHFFQTNRSASFD